MGLSKWITDTNLISTFLSYHFLKWEILLQAFSIFFFFFKYCATLLGGEQLIRCEFTIACKLSAVFSGEQQDYPLVVVLLWKLTLGRICGWLSVTWKNDSGWTAVVYVLLMRILLWGSKQRLYWKLFPFASRQQSAASRGLSGCFSDSSLSLPKRLRVFMLWLLNFRHARIKLV